jgi:hypothetical protein
VEFDVRVSGMPTVVSAHTSGKTARRGPPRCAACAHAAVRAIG